MMNSALSSSLFVFLWLSLMLLLMPNSDLL